jgi:hypothetical protein
MTKWWSGLRVAVAGVAVVTAGAGSVAGASGGDESSSIVLDDFESGELTGWQAATINGGWAVYSDAPPAQPGSDFPPAPPQGEFAAVTDTHKAGKRIVFPDVTLDGPQMLHLTVFYELGHGADGRVGSFSTPASLDWWDDRLQSRIDLVDPSAPIDSVADERARRCPSKRRSRTETPTSTGVRYHAIPDAAGRVIPRLTRTPGLRAFCT